MFPTKGDSWGYPLRIGLIATALLLPVVATTGAALTLPIVGGLLGGSGSASLLSLTAWAEPVQPHPGDVAELHLEIPGDAIIDVSLAEKIRCTATRPNGAVDTPCSVSGGLLDVRLLPTGSREFAFAYEVPNVLGTYGVHFDVSNLINLGLLKPILDLSGGAADTSFQAVSAPLPPAPPSPVPDPAPDPGPGPAPGPDPGPQDEPDDGPGPGPEDGSDDGGALGDDGSSSSFDGALLRWLLSSLGAGAAITVAALARRNLLGGMA